MLIKNIENTLLPITEFREHMTSILNTLSIPKVLMSRDKPKAVIVPYETYLVIEELLDKSLEDISDIALLKMATKRLEDSPKEFVDHDEFWDSLEV